MQPLDLIRTARKTARSQAAVRPRQSDLRRAISTAYYALFHALCMNYADCLIGRTGSDRSKRAWQQAYRTVEHGDARKRCANQNTISEFPTEIRDFALQFRTLQQKRHSADYDPHARFTRTEVDTDIDVAERVIKGFDLVSLKDRRAFAAWTAMKTRRT
ncbi:MAG: hypothetical protein GDA52_00810 [Rhodobacteraceae bacterium]|nr:hypothetical protein [Paracoccaceae bacterium]